MSLMSIANCYYCHGGDGYCTCQQECYSEDGLFTWQDKVSVFQPNVSEDMRSYVNPAKYYGEAFLSWVISNPTHYWAKPFVGEACNFYSRKLEEELL
jgi:hypothetical protein